MTDRSPPTPRSSASERLYRLMLRAYPGHFRRRYGVELLEAFREQRADAAYRGRGGTVRFWRDIGWDWLTTLGAARRAGRANNRATEDGRRSLRIEGGVVMQGLRQDLGFAVRSLLRAPAFTLIAVLTLAIGIGSNAAIYGVVDSVLMKPLPYGNPDRVITIWSQWTGFPKTWVSEAEYRTYLTQTRSFEDLTIWNTVNVSFTDPDRAERVPAASATENLASVFGVEMQLGRFFTREEAIRSDSLPASTIVISHDVWVRRWNADPGVIGTTAEVNGRQREVIGVLPEGFRLPTQFGRLQAAEVFFPMFMERTPVTDYPSGGGSHGWHMAGRLLPGVSVEQARLDLEETVRRVGNYPPDRAFRPLLYSASDDVFGAIRPAIMALLATVAFVLLIACANVANLMLARSDERASELAVRAALGAGRRRLVMQLLVESLVLAAVGGIAGIALAFGGVEVFKTLNPGNLPRINEVAIDTGVLVVVGCITVATALLFGVLPALRSTKKDLGERIGGRGERGIGRSGWQGTLVAAETALAVTLVIGAGLMARTFSQLTAIQTGFDGERTLTAAVSLPTTRYPDGAAATEFYREVLRQIEELPGVSSVGAIRSLPLAAQIGDWGIDVEGYDESVNPRAAGDWQIAAPGYFATIGIPIVQGRAIEWADDSDNSPVAVVNETFVRRYLPNQEPLGRTFVMNGVSVTIVGVVGDVRHNGLTEEIKAKFYIPVGQWEAVTRGTPTSMRLVARTAGDPDEMAPAVRAVVRGVDPSLAVAEVRTVDDVLSAAVAQPRFLVVLMGAFSGIALILAVIGVYGVISYGVGRRTQEIGIRMALGAMQDQVVGLMIRKGTAMIVVGLGTGTLLAFVLSRFLESQLYGVTPTDPITFVSVLVGFALVTTAAMYLPSRRAARIDPIRALKTD